MPVSGPHAKGLGINGGDEGPSNVPGGKRGADAGMESQARGAPSRLARMRETGAAVDGTKALPMCLADRIISTAHGVPQSGSRHTPIL